MRCLTLCVLLLAISEPLFIHAKVVLVVPRQVRRSPAVSWRPSSSHYKKSFYGSNDLHRHAYYANRYYNRKPYRPIPYPQGGDDFDHGHEVVNHVHVPYGKGIGHGISFGKGYIPYENVKSSSLPFVHERYAGAYVRQPAVQDYPPTGLASVGYEYAPSATAHTYDNPHADSFFSDMESAARGELHSNLKENTNKYYAARSIEKDLSLRNQQALDNVAERNKDSLAKGSELSKDASPVAYGHTAVASATTAAAGTQGAVILPAGIPPATIAGNKNGIVLRDTVFLDDYHQKLGELTQNWPNVLSAGAVPGGAFATQQLHAVDHHFPTAGLSIGGGGYGGAGAWLSNFAQPKQGYAVREDNAEPANYDFRTMPIHGATSQQLPPFGVNVGTGGGIVAGVHG